MGVSLLYHLDEERPGLLRVGHGSCFYRRASDHLGGVTQEWKDSFERIPPSRGGDPAKGVILHVCVVGAEHRFERVGRLSVASLERASAALTLSILFLCVSRGAIVSTAFFATSRPSASVERMATQMFSCSHKSDKLVIEILVAEAAQRVGGLLDHIGVRVLYRAGEDRHGG